MNLRINQCSVLGLQPTEVWNNVFNQYNMYLNYVISKQNEIKMYLTLIAMALSVVWIDRAVTTLAKAEIPRITVEVPVRTICDYYRYLFFYLFDNFTTLITYWSSSNDSLAKCQLRLVYTNFGIKNKWLADVFTKILPMIYHMNILAQTIIHD